MKQLCSEAVCSGEGGKMGRSVLESRKLVIAAVLLVFATILKQVLGEVGSDVLTKERTQKLGTSPLPLMFPNCACE